MHGLLFLNRLNFTETITNPWFVSLSEVRVYDPSGDATIPSTSKKRKLEEEEEAAPVTPVVKSKKSKKELEPEPEGE